MHYRPFGRKTGLQVSELILGGGMFGRCCDSKKEGGNLQKTSVADGSFWRCKERSGTLLNP